MKKSPVLFGILGFLAVGLVLFIGFYIWAGGLYDSAVKYDEESKRTWGNVQSAYQRRADLVPQLVATVKASAENEGNILRAVTQARAGITEATTPEELENAGRKINTAINLAFEAYPEIRSTANFATLQAQLEGTENRINVERNNYNTSVAEYNNHIRGFFRKMGLNFVADANEFPQKKMFETITENADKAPNVKELFE
jgi:LemA protein